MNTYTKAVFGLLLTASVSSNTRAESGTARSHIILMNLRTQTVGNVTPTDSLEAVKTKLGASNVKEFIYQAEGDRYEAYNVLFESAEPAKLYLSHFAITSRNFRTPEGLGVGATWGEFKKAYADGQLLWASDAGAVWSEKFKFRLYFAKKGEPSANDRVTQIHVNRAIVKW